MTDKVEYSRLRIKRTDFTGVSPTTPSGDTLNTFIDTDTFVGEFFLNTVDDRLWIRTDNGQLEVQLSGGTGFTESLSQTLSNGNETGGNSIYISQDDRIYSYSGNSYIEFNKVTDEVINLVSTDISGRLGEIGITPLDLSISYSDTGTTIGQIGIDENNLDLSFTDGIKTTLISLTPNNFSLTQNGYGEWVYFGSVTTTGSATTTIIEFDTSVSPFGNNKVFRVEQFTTAISSNNASGFTSQDVKSFRNSGGTLTQIGSGSYSSNSEFPITTGSDLTLYIPSNNIFRSRVRGENGTTINWNVVIKIYQT